MKPDYTTADGRIQLYLGDCLDVLPTLPDGYVDAVVTDPPYGIDFNRYMLHDDTPNGYGKWIWSVVEQCEQKSKPNMPVFIWQAMKNARYWTEWFPRNWRIFAACRSFTQFMPTSIQYSWDPVLFWGTMPSSPSVYRKDYHVQRLAPFGAYRESIKHPCPRPTEQVGTIVELASLPNSVILDPFMGSGTAGIACVRANRCFIGIEIDPAYFQVAVDRIETALAQPTLFDSAETQESVTQLALV